MKNLLPDENLAISFAWIRYSLYIGAFEGKKIYDLSLFFCCNAVDISVITAGNKVAFFMEKVFS